MAQSGVPYDITNFFVNKEKCMFYIRLKDVQNKKVKMYDVCKELGITQHHVKILLNGLKHHNLLDYSYDHDFQSYVPELTDKGRKVRSMMVALARFMVDVGIWKNVKVN